MKSALAHLAHVVNIEYWTLDDHEAGLCRPAEVGRRKPAVREAKRLAQQATPLAIRALIDVATTSPDPGAKVKAAQALLDRGWGRPTEHINFTDGELTADQLRELPTEALKTMVLRQLKEGASDINYVDCAAVSTPESGDSPPS